MRQLLIVILLTFTFNSFSQCNFNDTIIYYHPTCHGFANGQVFITINGNNSPFQIDILNSDSINVYIPGTGSNLNLISGWYYSSITDANGCVEIDSFELIDPEPILFDTLYSIPDFGLNSGSVICSVINGTPPYYYNWTNLQDNSQHFDSTWTFISAGSYNIYIIDSDGCSAMGNISVEYLNVENTELESTIKVFPTLITNQVLNITVGEIVISNQLIIYDLHGKVVLAKHNLNQKNSIAINLPNGLYYYHFTSDKKMVKTGKLIIEN